MEDAMRDLMGFHANGGSGEQPAHPSWQQGGAEHLLMDASYYLDDLLRNMQANATEADAPPAARGAAPLQNPMSPLHYPSFGGPIQTIPMRRPSPFTSQPRVAQPVAQRPVVALSEHAGSGSAEEASLDTASERSGQTMSASLITHRSVRSDPGLALHAQGPRSSKRGRSALAKEPEERSQAQERARSGAAARVRSSPRVSWKSGRAGGQSGGKHEESEEEEEDDDDEEAATEKKPKKGGGGGNREAVRKYRAKKKAQARDMELQLERLRGENAALSKRVAGQQALEREVGELRSLLLQLYGRLGEKPPARLQRAMADTGHTADSDKPAEEEDSKLALSGVEERPSSLNLLPTGNSSTLASVVLREGGAAAEAEVPSLAAAALPDFPGTDWLAAMSAMDAGNTSTLTSLAPPPPRAPLGFSYQNAALVPNRSPMHSTIQEGLAFSAPTKHQDFGSRFNGDD